jgi:hypothetical protein
MLTWITYRWELAPIEADLQRRTAHVLEAAGYDWAGAQFAGRDAILTGRAPEEGEPKAAVDLLRSVWGVRVAELRTDLMARVATYTWSAALDGGEITVRGVVPNEETKRAVGDAVAAAFPRSHVDDRSTLARGAERRDLWLEKITFALVQLGRLKQGTVEVEGSAFSIWRRPARNLRIRAIGEGPARVIRPREAGIPIDSHRRPHRTRVRRARRLGSGGRDNSGTDCGPH